MLLGCYHHTHIYVLCLLSPPHLGTLRGPLLSGSGQVQLAVPGAYEKPQLLALQPPVEAGPPATFTFHVNPMLHSRLQVELEQKLTALQVSEPTDGRRQAIESAGLERRSGASVQARFLHSEGLRALFLPAEQPKC